MSEAKEHLKQIRKLVSWLTIAVAIFLAVVVGLVAYQHTCNRITAPDFDSKITVDPSKVQGRPASEVGYRSKFDSPKRIATYATASRTPLEDLHGTITPSDLHFERHHAGIPEIDPGQHELLIHGLVEKPVRLNFRTSRNILPCRESVLLNVPAISVTENGK